MHDVHRVFELQSSHQWLMKPSTADERLTRLKGLKSVIKSREQEGRQTYCRLWR